MEQLLMALLRVRRAGQLTLPAELRKALKVKEGDYLEARLVDGGVLLSPVAVVDRAAAWNGVMKAAASVRDTKPKKQRGARADEEEIVRELKAHRRKHG